MIILLIKGKPISNQSQLIYTTIANGSGASIDTPILQNEKNKKLYISIDYVLELISGINGYKAVITKDNVLYSTFPSNSYKANKVGYFENNKFYVYDGYQLVKPLVYLNHKFTPEEIRDKKYTDIVIDVAFGFVTKYGAIISIAVNVSKIQFEYKGVDVWTIGGLYYRAFYTRRVVQEDTKNTNVPVAYQFVYIEIYYNSPSMDTIVYIEVTGEPPYKLDNNW